MGCQCDVIRLCWSVISQHLSHTEALTNQRLGSRFSSLAQNQFPVGDFRLWNFVNSFFLALDIVEIGLLGKTGNRIVYTRNGIILRV